MMGPLKLDTVLLLLGTLAIGCGDDGGEGGQGGSGGNEGTTSSMPATTATTSPTTPSSSSATTSATSSSTGNGGSGQGGSGQGGESGTCAALTPSSFVLGNADGTVALYSSIVTPSIDGADEDPLILELYGDPLDGGTPGTYDLAAAGDDDYATCARCFLVIADPSSANPRYFFQAAGTFELADASSPLDGNIDAQVTDLTLVEVTIDPATFATTPVPGGDCLEIGSFAISVGPPGGWTCSQEFYDNQDGCDCGCGVIDPDCPDALATSCEYCQQGASCANDGASDYGCDIPFLDPANSAVCAGVPSAWACDPLRYDSGLAGECDCGCGAFDPDCADATSASCNACELAASCANDGTPLGCDLALLDPTDNAECVSGGWTCDPQFYDNQDGCDCGCGIVDPDCPDASATSCQYCDSLSCANDGTQFGCDIPALDPMNSAVCTDVWACDPQFYDNQDGCDCGCGIVDPDCPDALATSCEFCDSLSCANDGSQFGCDLTALDPMDSAVCN